MNLFPDSDCRIVDLINVIKKPILKRTRTTTEIQVIYKMFVIKTYVRIRVCISLKKVRKLSELARENIFTCQFYVSKKLNVICAKCYTLLRLYFMCSRYRLYSASSQVW